MDLHTAIPGLDAMTSAERLELAAALWDSVVADPGALEIPDSHRRELDRRLARMEESPREGRTWEEVRNRLMEKKMPDGG